jgi:hypothetical protein
VQTLDTVENSLPPDLERSLRRVVELIEAERVPEARALVPRVVERWPESRQARHLFSVLQPPRVLSHPDDPVCPEREQRWLQRHARDYPGCWLAVYNDRLIAADPDIEKVRAAACMEVGLDRAYLHFEPSGRPSDDEPVV